MVVAGIDLSTKAIDLVLLDLDRSDAEWLHYQLPDGPLIDRIRAIGSAFPAPGAALWDDVIAIGIERPAGRFGVDKVAMAFGAVVSRLPEATLLKSWMPSEWRLACGLRGGAAKAAVREWVTGETAAFGPWSTDNGPFDVAQDPLDAYAVAYATHAALVTEQQRGSA